MLYALTRSELSTLGKIRMCADFTGAEMLMAVYRTDPDVVARILPRPLRPGPEPLALAFVGRYPKTNFGSVYNEGALFLAASYKGELGLYCLSMPVDDDMALIAGREAFGFPKKIAEEISLERDGDHVVGRIVRKEREILRIECDLDDEEPDDSLSGMARPTQDLEGNPCQAGTSFLFKFFPSPDNLGLDYRPRLVRQVTLFRPRAGLQNGTANVEVSSSRADPLGEVPVREVLSCSYGEWDNSMLPGRVVCRPLNVLRFLPHAFFKVDMFSLFLAEPPPPLGLVERMQLKLKLRRY